VIVTREQWARKGFVMIDYIVPVLEWGIEPDRGKPGDPCKRLGFFTELSWYFFIEKSDRIWRHPIRGASRIS
jgi:hypothetical protein